MAIAFSRLPCVVGRPRKMILCCCRSVVSGEMVVSKNTVLEPIEKDGTCRKLRRGQ